MTPIAEVEGRRIALSNLDKVLYPATGTTKGEVLHYCATSAGALLAHLANRPVSFLRYPDGPAGERFFTKNPPPGTPPGCVRRPCRARPARSPSRCWWRTWRR